MTEFPAVTLNFGTIVLFLKQFAVIASFGVQVIKRINDRSTRGSVVQTLLPSAMIGVCPVETGAI